MSQDDFSNFSTIELLMAANEAANKGFAKKDEQIRKLREALTVVHDELLSLNKTVGWRDGEWHSVQVAREALKEES